jgi:hypothetical protein
MTRQVISVKRLNRVSLGMAAVTLTGPVSSGPADSLGRDVRFFVGPDQVAHLIAALAAMPLYRDVFGIVAGIMDARAAVANDPDAAPVLRVQNDLSSLETREAIMAAITQEIDRPR